MPLRDPIRLELLCGLLISLLGFLKKFPLDELKPGFEIPGSPTLLPWELVGYWIIAGL
jgi:hypothetical protein